MQPTLLPSGLMDVLPPFAAAEFRLIHHFLKTFTGFGYAPVIPPLAEFAQSMLTGQGEATSHQVFRLSDPLSPQMLSLRADMTAQVARIAAGALAAAPRPLRLCYAGYTLRTTAEALKTRRQHTQVGIERFGGSETRAVAEVLAIAVHALGECGVEGITIDLHFPSVMQALLAEVPPAQHERLREAVRLKNTAQLRALGADTIAQLVETAGLGDTAQKALSSMTHPAIQQAHRQLAALTQALAEQAIPAMVTIDMLDLAGYGYYSGIGYALYWNAAALEVGRGGCYRSANGEDAVGFTLYINELLDRLGAEKAQPVKTIPYGTPAAQAAALQAQGFVTVFAENDPG